MWINVDWLGLLVTSGAGIATYVGWLMLLARSRFSTIDLLLAAFIAATCHVLGMLLVLGTWQQLTASSLAWIAVVSTAVVYGAAILRAPRIVWRQRWTSWHVAICDMLISIHAKAVLALLCLTGAWVLLLACIFPAYAFDEFMYHMPIVASILQNRSVVPPDSSVVFISAYPRYSELLSVWTSIFTGRDTFADVAMIPFWVFGGVAVFGIARKTGATRSWSLLCACIWWFCPTTIIQAKSTYNDVMVAAVWAIAVALLMPVQSKLDGLSKQTPVSTLAILFAGLATGLLFGTKISGVVFAVSLVGMLLLSIGIVCVKMPELVRRCTAFCLAAIVSAGPWLAISWQKNGNPMYPIPIRILGIEIWSGAEAVVRNAMAGAIGDYGQDLPVFLRYLGAFYDAGDSYQIGARLSGFGPAFAVVGVPALLMLLVVGSFKRRWFLLCVTLIGILPAIMLPAGWTPRFSLTMLIVSGFALAFLQSVMSVRVQSVTSWVVVATSLAGVLLNMDLGSFNSAKIREFAVLSEHERIATKWDPGSFGESHRRLLDLTTDSESESCCMVAYAGFMLPYPLWGHGFSNRVVYIRDDGRMPYSSKLRAADVDLFFASREAPESKRLSVEPDAVLLHEGSDGYVIYRIAK